MNVFSIGLLGLELGAFVHTVNAWVCEQLSVDYPEAHIGDADFFTIGTTLDFDTQVVSVTFYMDWDSPLPVVIMTNLGYA